MPSSSDAWDPEKYSSNASFVYSSNFTRPVMGLLQPKPGERILDLGCGSGELTLELAHVAGPGHVTGLDSSENLISKAKELDVEKAVSWVVLDGHQVGERHNAEYDAVFTNAALHWMKRDPELVSRGVFKALKPGGRYAGEFGGFLNMVGVRSALHTSLTRRGIDPERIDPWYFPTVEEYSGVLKHAGFTIKYIELVPRITALPKTGLKGWLDTFAFDFFNALPQDQIEAVKEEIDEALSVDMKHSNGYSVMYVRLRFLAVKE